MSRLSTVLKQGYKTVPKDALSQESLGALYISAERFKVALKRLEASCIILSSYETQETRLLSRSWKGRWDHSVVGHSTS